MRHLTVREKFVRAIKKHKNLVAYYPMNEVEGTTARNYAPATKGSHNGTITGNLDIGQAGKIGRAFSNNGNTAKRVTVSHNAALANAQFSISFILKIQTTGHQSAGTNAIVLYTNFQAPPNGKGWYIRHNGTTGTGVELGMYFNDAEVKISSTPTADVWTHICVTFDGDNIILYKNGVQSSSSTTGTTHQVQESGSIQMLSGFGGINAALQHVALFNKALTQNEITKLARIANFA